MVVSVDVLSASTSCGLPGKFPGRATSRSSDFTFPSCCQRAPPAPPPPNTVFFFCQCKHFQLPAAVPQERAVKLLPNHLYPLQLERGRKPQVRLSRSLAVIGISRDECAKRVSDGCSLAFKEIMDGAVSAGLQTAPCNPHD